MNFMSERPNVEHIPWRAKLLRTLRQYFDDRGFHEVQPPCLMRQCIVDTYIDPITVSGKQLSLAEANASEAFYLQTSPELAMKRLLAAGSGSIYAIAPVFRGGESGDQHNIEFTMLEWYEVGADLQGGIETLGSIAKTVLGHDRYEVRTYRDLFQEHLSIDPIDEPIRTLCRLASQVDDSLAQSLGEDRDALLDVLMSHLVQPHLGLGMPMVVKNYPLTQAALARRCEDDPQCAARFELFYLGVELANGYDELRDPDVLVQRTNQTNQKRAELGRLQIPMPHSLIDAMRDGLPACAGVAMGVDRLMMVCSGDGGTPSKVSSISDVMPMTMGQV